MEREPRMHPLTDLDVTVRHLLPDSFTTSGFLYALLLTATLVLSVLSVFLFL